MKCCFLLSPFFKRGACCLFFLEATLILDASTNLRGSLGIHDPSAVIKCGDRYYVFGTGQGIISKSSADKIYWVTGPSVFASAPGWTKNIHRLHRKYLLGAGHHLFQRAISSLLCLLDFRQPGFGDRAGHESHA